MTQPAKGQEPSMEEILASIRRIISEDSDGPKADAVVEELVELVPESPAPFLLVAELALNMGQRERAARYVERAEKLAPDDPAVQALRQKIGK